MQEFPEQFSIRCNAPKKQRERLWRAIRDAVALYEDDVLVEIPDSEGVYEVRHFSLTKIPKESTNG